MSLWTDLLQGLQTNPVLRERVALAEQKFKDMEAENKALKDTVAALTAENAKLTAERDERAARDKAAEVRPTIKWGCYVFEGDEGMYCPGCYTSKGKRNLTTRLDTRQRQCTVCRVILGSG